MEAIKRQIQYFRTPRQNTDLQSEILNVIAVPIYIYTFTCVVVYSIRDVLPYHYTDGNGERNEFMIRFHTFNAILFYVEMMANWLCIRYVDNSLKSHPPDNAPYSTDTQIDTLEPTCIIVNQSVNGNAKNKSSKSKGRKPVIPGPTSAPPVVKKKSYWSWKWCDRCKLNAPPRCHHCPMCDTCVLKRDHHCFFSARCVGFYNQRHFTIFCVWAAVGTIYSTLYFLPYFAHVISPRTTAYDVFAPFTFLRWILGYTSLSTVNIIFTFTMNFFFIFLSSGFILDQFDLIKKGLTQFEAKSIDTKKLVISDPRTLGEKVRAVFGYNYGLSLVFPFAHLIFPPHDNPYEWPEHKIHRNQLR